LENGIVWFGEKHRLVWRIEYFVLENRIDWFGEQDSLVLRIGNVEFGE